MSEKNSKVLYFDPNNTFNNQSDNNITAIFNGVDLFKDPEDYSIAVDLEVETINSESNKVTDKLIATTNKDSKITNFFEGKKIGETNVLTSYFTDITYSKEGDNYDNEALSINSIDIEFTSWYVASVIIKFTDVRGASLFSQAEYNKINSDNSKPNVLSPFFTMPYPIFKLRVKGIYGKSVTYELHCTDFKAEFNNDKGNFDITTHFIGHTFAILSDIQLGYLMAAPYFSLYGKDYWDREVKSGRFTSIEGQPLPKLPELIEKIVKGQNIETKINENDDNSKKIKELDKQLTDILSIKSKLNNYKSVLKNKTNKFNDNKTVNLLELSIKDNPSFNPNNTELINIIKDLKSSLKTPNIDLSGEFSNNLNINIINTIVYNVDLTKIYKYIDNFELISKNSKAELTNKVNLTLNDSLYQVYGLTPTIFNINKLLLAHVETLLYSISACANDAKKRDIKTHEYGTDLKGNKLDPFPWLRDVNGKDEWIGEFYPDFSEVKFIQSVIQAKTDVNSEIEKIYNITSQPDVTTVDVENGDFWFPLNVFDNSISGVGAGNKKSPYSHIGPLNGDGLNNFKYLLSLRAMMAISLGVDKQKDIKSFSLGEVENIYSNYINSNDIDLIISTIDDIINKLSSPLNYNRVDNKYNPLLYAKDKISKNEYVKYNLGNQKLSKDINSKLLPLFSGTYNEINKIKNKNFYYNDTNSVSSKTDINVISIKILDGTDNVRNIEENLYKRIKNEIGDRTYFNGIIDDKYNISRELSSKYYSNKILYKNFQTMNRMTGLLINPDNYSNEIDIKKDNYDKFFVYNRTKADNIIAYPGSLSDNREVFNKIISETSIDNSETDLSYPLIGGIEYLDRNFESSSVFTLFGHPIYYSQEDHKGQKYGNELKAWMFLQTLPLDVDLIEKEILNLNDDNFSKMWSIPKSALLLAGSVMWRIKEKVDLIDSKNYSVLPVTLNGVNYGKGFGYDRYLKKSDGTVKLTSYIHDFWFNEDSDYLYKKSTFSKLYINENNKYDIKLSIINSKISDYLIKYFLDWANIKNKSDDSWYNIRNSFELRYKNGNTVYGPDFMNEIKVHSSKQGKTEKYKYLRDTFTQFSNKTYDVNYNYNVDKIENGLLLVNTDNSQGVKSMLKLLLTESVLMSVGGRWDLYPKINDFKEFFTTIKTELKKKKNSTITETTPILNSQNNNIIDENIDISLQTYKHLKIVYDKWIRGSEFDTYNSKYKWIESTKSNINGYSAYDVRNFKFIDRSYNDIGSKFIINLKDVYNTVINVTTQKSLYSVITEILSKNQFLFIPMPNYQKWENVKDFSDIFQPVPYINSDISINDNNLTSVFICMYAGNPSKSLNIGNSEYYFQDDALNLKDTPDSVIEDDFKDYKTPNAEDVNQTVISNTSFKNIPVFEVSYGKQNQSYFKNISLNMNNPNVTDVMINSLKNVVENSNQKSGIEPIGQDIYALYSEYSYNCQVEMLGCPQIQPMMYFQLQNIPMWNGAYLIYKVNHSIRPGAMSTSFTGMRMGRNYAKFITTRGLSVSSFGSKLTGTDISEIDKTKKISGKSLDEMLNQKIGKYFTFKDFIKAQPVISKNGVTYAKNGYQDYISVGIDSRLRTLAATLDSIYDTWSVSDDFKKYGAFKINVGGGYRTKEYNEAHNRFYHSAHEEGLAADIGLVKNETPEGLNALYEHIKLRMTNGLKIDQLLYEANSWIHISPANIKNGEVVISGYHAHTDKNGHATSDIGTIQQSVGNGRVMNNSEVLQQFINYWKDSEASKVREHHWYDNVWHVYTDVNEDAIAYGLRLKYSSEKFKNLVEKQNNTCTDEQAIEELKYRIDETLNVVNKKLGTSSKIIVDRYKYALCDLLLNHRSNILNDGQPWNPFFNAVVKYGSTENNIDKILKEVINRSTDKRSNAFIRYLKG